jgi:hypothetical protein
VTVVDGGAVLERCLAALSTQADAPAMEVVVPYDDTIADVARLAGRFPRYRFVAMGTVAVPGSTANAFGQHVLYDCRRSAGLKAAQGRYVAMLEDRGWPRADWASAMVGLHERIPDAVVGGAIESGAADALRQALYYCDFGRYEPPLEVGDAAYASDVNICYKRTALESVRPLWETRYQEATVNWALRRQGEQLRLSDRPRVIEERGPVDLKPALAERVHWGRTFGYVRGREGSRAACLLRIALAPLVPAVLLWRHVRKQFAVPRGMGRSARVLPVTFLLMVCWSLGEAIGELDALFAPREPKLAAALAVHRDSGVHHERSC